jgi:hypothetical protein
MTTTQGNLELPIVTLHASLVISSAPVRNRFGAELPLPDGIVEAVGEEAFERIPAPDPLEIVPELPLRAGVAAGAEPSLIGAPRFL